MFSTTDIDVCLCFFMQESVVLFLDFPDLIQQKKFDLHFFNTFFFLS